MKYITVLDFEAGRVFQYEIEDKFIDNGAHLVMEYIEGQPLDEYITNKGHNLSNCEWMIHENPQVITN